MSLAVLVGLWRRKRLSVASRFCIGSSTVGFLLLAGVTVALCSCDGNAGARSLSIGVNIAEAAEGHVAVFRDDKDFVGKGLLSARQCLCDWKSRDLPRVCAFTSTTLILTPGVYDLQVFDARFGRKCWIRRLSLRPASKGFIVLDCDPEPLRAVRRSFLCAYIDGTTKARKFVERVSANIEPGFTADIGRILLHYWEQPEQLPAPSYFGRSLDVIELPICGRERKPITEMVELELELDADGYAQRTLVVESSGVAEVDQWATYVTPDEYIPALMLGSIPGPRIARLKWVPAKLRVRVRLHWMEECPRFD